MHSRSPHPGLPPAALGSSIALLVVALAAPLPAGASEAEPRRLTAEAFGAPVEIEVRDLSAERARTVLRDAFHHLRDTERLLSEAAERLNADAQTERAVALAPPVLTLLERAQSFCHWSNGAVGPLGGGLLDHWRAVGANPAPPPVPASLAATTACDRLALDPVSATARVAAGSRVDLRPFAVGFAIDRTVETLRERGSGNGRVRVGRIERAFGPGPHPADAWGDPLPPGWPASLPDFESYEEPVDRLRLTDGALAVLWRADWPAGRPLHVDLRTGRPPGTVWATVAVTELALDAQALSVAAMVLGAREGRFRMAGLSPEPAILWLMGSGRGRPLRSDLNWSRIDTY